LVSKEAIDKFLKQKTLAVVGVSRSGKKFGNSVYKELKSKGYKLYPIHPEMKTYDGEDCYPSLSSLPEKVGGVFIAVSPEKTEEIVKEAKNMGIDNIWIQQKSESEKAVSFCNQNELNLIHNECLLMYANPVGFPHSIHRFIWKVMGKMPQ